MATVCVLVKSVPVGGRFLRIDGEQLSRDGVPHGIDPINEVALEWALTARRDEAVSKVVAACMGPGDARDALRRAVAMGCDETLHVCDPGLAGADVRTTSTVLAAAVRLVDASLALFGNESLDGSSGAVPSAVAARLDWPLVSLARTASVSEGVVRARRDLGGGPQIVEADLPAVVSFVAGGITPRYPKLREVLASRNEALRTVSLGDLGVTLPAGRAGERVLGLVDAKTARKVARVLSADEGVEEIATLLASPEA